MHIGQIHTIPLNEQTSYVIGVIIGDGYVSKSFKSANGRSYKVSIDSINYEYLCTFAAVWKTLVNTNAEIRNRKLRERCKPCWSFGISDKSFWHFLVNTLKIPAGAKSRKVEIPEQIRTASVDIKRHFIAGLFDTDGGLTGGTIGITSASKVLSEQLQLILLELGFSSLIARWINRKNGVEYYCVRLRRKDIDRFLNEVPMKYFGKVKAIINRFSRGGTEVV